MNSVKGDTWVLQWEEFSQSLKENDLFQTVSIKEWEKTQGDVEESRYMLSEGELLQKRLVNKELIKAAKPYVEHLSLNFLNKPHLVVLVDQDGWGLLHQGTGLFTDSRYKLGINWSMTSVGDNGLGRALFEERPVLTYGMEFFDAEVYDGISFGIPIAGEAGTILGILGVLTTIEYVQPIQLSFALTVVGFIGRAYATAQKVAVKLAQAERFLAMGSMLATTVHDLKNPLANIRAVSQLGSMQSRGTKAGDYFLRIMNNVDTMSDMLNALMKTYRSEEMYEVSLKDNLLKLLEEIEPICTLKQIQLEQDFEIDFKVRLKPGMFKRVMENLLRNAIQVMGEGGVLTIKATVKEAKAVIVVQDTGPGIPEKIQSEIFEPFVHGRKDGIGLGLYMVYYAITEVHRGRVWFETGPWGTAFFIELPSISEL